MNITMIATIALIRVRFCSYSKCPVLWANLICKETIKRIADVDVSPYTVSRDENESKDSGSECEQCTSICILYLVLVWV